ncbi:MAG: hypothetical protein WCF04_05125 [Candidatus Nanopelagicales bacterium]
MVDSHALPDQQAFAKELRTPTAAAVAGLVFSGILIAVLVLLHTSVPTGQAVPGWVNDPGRRRAVRIATSLIPFAGISFLWFIGVIRTRIGAREDKLFATVFLGSGLLFVGLLFTSSAFLGTVLVLFDQGMGVGAESMVSLQVLTRELMGTFGTRMAAVFTISVSSVGMRTRVLPRWLVVVGFMAGLALLLSPPLTRWAQLVFPAWVLLVSLQILSAGRGNRT